MASSQPKNYIVEYCEELCNKIPDGKSIRKLSILAVQKGVSRTFIDYVFSLRNAGMWKMAKDDVCLIIMRHVTEKTCEKYTNEEINFIYDSLYKRTNINNINDQVDNERTPKRNNSLTKSKKCEVIQELSYRIQIVLECSLNVNRMREFLKLVVSSIDSSYLETKSAIILGTSCTA